jgi:hypothetical protein
MFRPFWGITRAKHYIKCAWAELLHEPWTAQGCGLGRSRVGLTDAQPDGNARVFDVILENFCLALQLLNCLTAMIFASHAKGPGSTPG